MATRTARLQPLWLSASETAALLGIGTRTLWRLLADGKFPEPHRFSRKLVRWNYAALVAYTDRLQDENVVEPPPTTTAQSSAS